MPAKMNLFNTQWRALTRSSIFPMPCPTEPLNFLHPIPFYLSGATSLSAKGTLTQPPLLSSMSRHCCCEDEMSVLLKVPLKHNSDLWCLIVSFQSYEWGREKLLTHSGHFKAVTDYWGGGHNVRRTATPWCSWKVLVHHYADTACMQSKTHSRLEIQVYPADVSMEAHRVLFLGST